MRLRKTIWWCLALVLPFSQPSADSFDEDYEVKSWAEIEVQLPAFPEKSNLIPFRVGAITDYQYLIDGKSLSVGSDGVLRFALVVISPSGAQNISFEGLRCSTAERRFYASGRSDKTWSKARSNKWVGIQGGSNNQYVELYKNYFCSVGALEIMNADDARRALRYGGQPAATRP